SRSKPIGTRNTDPALARTAFGFHGSTPSPQNSTAATPAASATRTRVPALPGSPTVSSTNTKPQRSDVSTGSGTVARAHKACAVTGDVTLERAPSTTSTTKTPCSWASAITSVLALGSANTASTSTA